MWPHFSFILTVFLFFEGKKLGIRFNSKIEASNFFLSTVKNVLIKFLARCCWMKSELLVVVGVRVVVVVGRVIDVNVAEDS